MSASEVLVTPQTARFARAGDNSFYTWEGVQYPRVTSIVDMFTGGHLPMWYAQMACEENAEIVAKCQRGELGRDEMEAMILDTNSRKTAAIRYRDEKGAIGHLAHHAAHEKLLGVKIPETEVLDYLQSVALSKGYADPDRDEGTEPYSLTLARKARHYTWQVWDWLDRAEIELEAIGLEAMIVSQQFDYAGTGDLFGTANTKWLRRELGKDFPESLNDYSQVRLCGDYKTTNLLNVAKIRLQTSGYTNADFIGLISEEGRQGAKYLLPQTDACFALHIKPLEKCKMVLWQNDPADFEALLSLRQAFGHLYGSKMSNPRKRSTPKIQIDRSKAPF